MIEDEQAIEDALRFWASTYPRRVTKYQRWATSIPEAAETLAQIENDPENAAYISTYSFPSGHSSDKNVPRVDRLFIDFDVPDDGDYRSGKQREDVWVRDMSRLLVRTRKVATYLLNGPDPGCWQAALSGHKGVHLDLVFPPIAPENGTYEQFNAGLSAFVEQAVERLEAQTKLTDLHEYVDVSSADMSRMRRVPNTKHTGATDAFGEDRFCVPVTLKELAQIGPAEYIELTRSRRKITPAMKATPNEVAGEMLTQAIRTASPGGNHQVSGSSVDYDRLHTYVENQNDNISKEDIPFVLSHRPCVLAFIERDDAFSNRAASHLMEMKAITEMMRVGVPIETETNDDTGWTEVVGGPMVDFFEDTPGFDREYTCDRVTQYICRQYVPVSCDKIWQQADQFCVGPSCGIYVHPQHR